MEIILPQKKKVWNIPVMAILTLLILGGSVVAGNVIGNFTTIFTIQPHATSTTNMPSIASMKCGGLVTYNWSVTNLANQPHNFTTVIKLEPVISGESKIVFEIFGKDNFSTTSGELIVPDNRIAGNSFEDGQIHFQMNSTCSSGLKNLTFSVFPGSFAYKI